MARIIYGSSCPSCLPVVIHVHPQDCAVIELSQATQFTGVRPPAGWRVLCVVVAVVSVMASCLTWLAWHHRPPSASLRVTPGFTDAAARFHGQRCEADCARKVDGYAWAMLGDIRDESACRRHMGAFKEGCVTYVTDRDAQRSWSAKALVRADASIEFGPPCFLAARHVGGISQRLLSGCAAAVATCRSRSSANAAGPAASVYPTERFARPAR